MTENNWITRAQNSHFDVYNTIDGQRRSVGGNERIAKHSPRDGSLLYSIATGDADDVAAAVAAAKRSYKDKRWRGLPLSQRQAVLNKLADLIDAHQETFALYECLDAGKPISQALGEIGMASGALREAAAGADKIFSPYLADGTYCAYQCRKPVGVVGAITSWNYPLLIAAIKVGPALVMGNSMVLKPSEHASLSASYLAALALEAGVPEGVLNLVVGSGQTVGNALAQHDEVDLLSFTGSSAVGGQLQVAAGQSNMKRLLLECGGKSPYIVFDDAPADLDSLVVDIVDTAFQNQSQNCMAGSRLLIQESLKEQLLPKVIEQAAQLKPQDILNPDSHFGAMVHEAHMHKVLGYIESGKEEGAQLVAGGKRVHVDTGTETQGFYLEPTIFDQVRPEHKIAQEEIFGPVLSVLSFKDEAEAIELANNTCYGLGGTIATENISRAQRMIQELRAGMVAIVGTGALTPCYVELGREGQRASGFGHEGGLSGLLSYSVTTSVHQWA